MKSGLKKYSVRKKMERAIYVIPRSEQNVFEISYACCEAYTLDKNQYFYFRYVHDAVDIWLLLKVYLERDWLEVNETNFIVRMELDWLKKFLDRVIDNDDLWHQCLQMTRGY